MTTASSLFLPAAAPGGTARGTAAPSPVPSPSRVFSQALQQAREQPREVQRPRERDVSASRARDDRDTRPAERAAADQAGETPEETAGTATTDAVPAHGENPFAFAAVPVMQPAAPGAAIPPGAAAGIDAGPSEAAHAAVGVRPAPAGLVAGGVSEAISPAHAQPSATAGTDKSSQDNAPAPLAELPVAFDGDATALAEEADALLQQALQETGPAASSRGSVPTTRAPDAPVGLAALQALQPVSTASAAAPATVARQIDTPADAAEFPEALASQVGYLVRDGVQQARLTLNPAEMGPISVQIAVQGQQAQVDFAAASAATRAAIESSLSHLAAALQEAGLTLSGGGVSQHHEPRQPRGGHAAQADRRVLPGDGSPLADAPRAAAPAHRVDGRLDLYA